MQTKLSTGRAIEAAVMWFCRHRLSRRKDVGAQWYLSVIPGTGRLGTINTVKLLINTPGLETPEFITAVFPLYVNFTLHVNPQRLYLLVWLQNNKLSLLALSVRVGMYGWYSDIPCCFKTPAFI